MLGGVFLSEIGARKRRHSTGVEAALSVCRAARCLRSDTRTCAGFARSAPQVCLWMPLIVQRRWLELAVYASKSMQR